ncbi:MAG: carbohydrate-binding domain-containing protein [Gemmataceae bacterium]
MDTTLIGGLVGRQYFRADAFFEDVYEFQVTQPAFLDAQLSLLDPGTKGKIFLDIDDNTFSPLASASDDTGALHLSLPGSDDFLNAVVGSSSDFAHIITNYSLALAVDRAPGDYTADDLAIRADQGRDLGTLSDVGIVDMHDFIGYLDTDLHAAHDFVDTYFFDVPTFGAVEFAFGGLEPDASLLGNPVAKFKLFRDIDNDGRLENAAEILASGDLPFGDTLSHVNKNLNAGHYAVVIENSVLATGGSNYHVQMDYSPADDAGSTLATARNIGTLSSNGQVFSDYLSPDDKTDLYRFSTLSGGPFVLTGQLDKPSGADFKIDLISDANNNGTIDSGEILASGVNLNAPFTTPGIYFVRVKQNSGEGSYTLTVSNRNTDLAGDTLAPGVALNIGNLFAEVRLSDFLSSTDTADIIKFTLTSSGSLKASFPTTAKGTDADLELIQDKNNNLVIDSNEILNFSRNVGPTGESVTSSLVAGTYFVRLLRKAGSPSYDLTLSLDSAGSTVSTARLMTLSGDNSSTIEFVGPNDPTDLYKLNLLDGTRLSIAMSLLDQPVILSVGQDTNGDGMLDIKEELLSASITTGSSIQSLNVPKKGQYLVKVVPLGSATTHYGIVFGDGPPDNAGNSLATARDLGTLPASPQKFADVVGSRVGTFGDDDFDDFYRFTLADGGPYIFQSQIFVGVTGNVGMQLIRDVNRNHIIDDGEVLATTVSIPNPPNLPLPPNPIVSSLIEPGVYYLHVFSVAGQASYTLSMSAVSTDGVGNTLGTAKDLGQLTTTLTASEFVGGIDSTDIYRFSVAGPCEISVSRASAGRVGFDVIHDTDNDLTVDPGEDLTLSRRGSAAIHDLYLASAGIYYLRVVPFRFANTQYDVNLIFSSQTPFTTPFQITNDAATTIEAENFDRGGEGVAYHDTTPGNSGNATGFRSSENINVDVAITSDVGGGNHIAATAVGEFLEYSLNSVGVFTSSTLEFRVASSGAGAGFHVEIDGVAVTQLIQIPDTGGFQNFITLSVPNVFLKEGPHIMRLAMDTATSSGSAGIYNFITFLPSSQSTGTFALTPAETTAVPDQHTQLSLAWTVPAGGWHTLKDVQIRLLDDQGIALWIKFDEAANTVSLFNPASGKFGPAQKVGSSGVLSNQYATLYLSTSSVHADGPSAATVLLTFDISFKSSTRGRLFRIEAAAGDDFGREQPFELAGFLEVLYDVNTRRRHYA